MRIVAFTLAMALPVVAAPCRRRAADLRRARALQPRRVGQPAAEGRDRDPAPGRRQARPGLELRRRGHAAAGRRGARLVVPSLRPYRTRGDISTWVRDETVAAYLEERLARHATPRSASFTSTAPTPTCRCRGAWWRWPASTAWCCTPHSDADAIERLFASSRRRASCGRTPGSIAREAVRDDAAQAPQPVVRSRFPQRAGHGRQGARRVARRCSPSSPTGSWSAPTPTRRSAGITSSSTRAWSRAWLADLPPPLAERIAYRNADALFAGWKRPAANERRPRSPLRCVRVPAAVALASGRRLRRSAARRDAHDRRQGLRRGLQDGARPDRRGRSTSRSISPCARARTARSAPRRARRCRHAGAPARDELPARRHGVARRRAIGPTA